MSDSYTFLSFSINLLELIAAIMATIYYWKYKNSTERYFLYFLWFTFFTDAIVGTTLGFFKIDNTWIYYAYTGISFLFYYWWYYNILGKKLHKKLILIFAFIFIAIYIFNGVQITYHHYSFIFGAFFLLILAGLHLHQLFNADDIINLSQKLNFMITIALVLFNISMVPFILLTGYFNFWISDPIFISILFFLNLLLYSCYILGFIWTKQKYNHF